MKRDELRAPDFVNHMIEATQRIERYTRGKTRQEFFSDLLIQDAVIRNFEILGEASKNLLEELPNAPSLFPEIPFGKIYGTRNQLSHGYFTIDFDIIWETIKNRIPKLRVALEAAAKSLKA